MIGQFSMLNSTVWSLNLFLSPKCFMIYQTKFSQILKVEIFLLI